MELSLTDIRELLIGNTLAEPLDDGGFVLGEKVFIRTVTNYFLGLVQQVTATSVTLLNASWVADTGLFSEALEKGTLNEVEPYVDDVVISRTAIIDHTAWRHSLPKERK